MPIEQIHARIGNAALLFMVIAGVWGLLRWRQKKSVDSNYFGILVVGELLLIAQAAIGIYMWLALGRASELERSGMHFLYGFLTVLTLPAAYSFSQGKMEGVREQALYALVCLFLAALVFRASMTSTPALSTLIPPPALIGCLNLL